MRFHCVILVNFVPTLEYSYDDVYGRSLDDEVAISPNTAGS